MAIVKNSSDPPDGLDDERRELWRRVYHSVSWLRQEAAKMRRAAKSDPSRAATHRETAMRLERTADDVEESLKDI